MPDRCFAALGGSCRGKGERLACHGNLTGRREGMDRLDAMNVFVLAVDEGSLAAAGRKLGRSPAAVSRAIAFLEERVGAELLHRTTRSIRLSEEGERYVAI